MTPSAAKNIALAAVSVLLVAAIVVAFVVWRHESHLSSQQATRNSVASVAGSLADAILTYNAADLSQSEARVKALATQDFVNNYNQNFTQALTGSIVALKASATATVREVYVADVTSTTADAIVVADFETKSKSGNRSVVGSHLEMHLIRQSGAWKVNEVDLLSVSSENQTPVFGGPTTTTLVPPKT